MKSKLLLLLLLASAFGRCEDQNRNYIVAGVGYGTLPQIADGGCWKTTITLVNLDTAASSWKVEFLGDNGNPKEFDLAGRGRATVFTGVLANGGSTTLETLGGCGALNQGWARVSSPSYNDVGAMVIFGTSGIPGRLDFEASVPGSRSWDGDVMIPFDNANGFVTSLAFLNTSTYSDAVLNIQILDESGLPLAIAEVLTLKPLTKVAFASTDRWAVSRGRRGTIFITESGNVSNLALRFNPGGAFTTVFPMSR